MDSDQLLKALTSFNTNKIENSDSNTLQSVLDDYARILAKDQTARSDQALGMNPGCGLYLNLPKFLT